MFACGGGILKVVFYQMYMQYTNFHVASCQERERARKSYC